METIIVHLNQVGDRSLIWSFRSLSTQELGQHIAGVPCALGYTRTLSGYLAPRKLAAALSMTSYVFVCGNCIFRITNAPLILEATICEFHVSIYMLVPFTMGFWWISSSRMLITSNHGVRNFSWWLSVIPLETTTLGGFLCQNAGTAPSIPRSDHVRGPFTGFSAFSLRDSDSPASYLSNTLQHKSQLLNSNSLGCVKKL